MAVNRALKATLALALAAGIAGCSGHYGATEKEASGPQSGPKRQQIDENGSVFGDGGLSLSGLRDGSFFGFEGERGGSLPVNKYLWQASLDTLSFLPLNSTDPFTGVIATDWGSTPDAPGERFKVTAYVLNPNLAASSLRVAVYREARNEEGLWVPAAVSPDTALKLEDAILVRARQIRVAENNDGATAS